MNNPLKNNLIIKIIPMKQETETGIIVAVHPEQSCLIRQVYPNTAKVVNKGKGMDDFEIGETIVFERWGSREINEELCVINKKDIIAKINPSC